MTLMRAGFAVVIVPAALAVIDVRPGAAEVYRPWCVQYMGGYSSAISCTFYSFEQCMETARGNGAFCVQNPWYLQYGSGQKTSDDPRGKPRRRGGD